MKGVNSVSLMMLIIILSINYISKLTMRLIRPHSINKQNVEPLGCSTDRSKVEDMRKELKNAYAQIMMLKTSNKQLTRRLQASQKQRKEAQTMRQELDFLKEQDENTRQQLVNYEEMNKKLREQLQRIERENKQLKHYSSTEIESKSTSRNYYNNQQATPRSSLYNNRMNSSPNERVRSNHSSTPKSKVQINWGDLVQDKRQQKRVFL